jgi:hypothetical protein
MSLPSRVRDGAIVVYQDIEWSTEEQERSAKRSSGYLLKEVSRQRKDSEDRAAGAAYASQKIEWRCYDRLCGTLLAELSYFLRAHSVLLPYGHALLHSYRSKLGRSGGIFFPRALPQAIRISRASSFGRAARTGMDAPKRSLASKWQKMKASTALSLTLARR